MYKEIVVQDVWGLAPLFPCTLQPGLEKAVTVPEQREEQRKVARICKSAKSSRTFNSDFWTAGAFRNKTQPHSECIPLHEAVAELWILICRSQWW